jgi:hypothetical protein
VAVSTWIGGSTTRRSAPARCCTSSSLRSILIRTSLRFWLEETTPHYAHPLRSVLNYQTG